MRGIKAVLYVAFALCFISAAFALNCNMGEDGGNGVCRCQSGYIPADNCATLLGGATNCHGQDLSYTEANHFPSLDVITQGATRFEGNHLYAKIQGEYVSKRQYKELKFTVPNANGDVTLLAKQAKCALAGDAAAYWTQTTTVSACNDTFNLDLPWISHPDCGFANNTKLSGQDAENMYISGYFHIAYVDWIGEVENFTLTRSTSVPYSITVKFQRHVTVQLKALNVSSDVRYGMALTEDVFDPTTEILTLELTTIINWPNQFYTNQGAMTFYKPSQVVMQQVTSAGALGGAYDVYPQDISCETAVENSPCRQSFTFKAKTDQLSSKNCTFDGEYNLEINLYTCRSASSGDQPTCTHTKLNITFSISDSNVCGEIGVTPSVTGELISFPNSVNKNFRDNIGQKTSFFKLGTYANFFASIASDNNEISIVFTEIKFQVHADQQTSNQWTTLYTNVAGTKTGNADIIIVKDTSKYFNIYFHSSVFKVQPNSRVVYTFSAVCEVSFMGNDGFVQSNEKAKRTVEYTWTQATAEAETNVFIAGATNSIGSQQVAQTPAGVTSVTFIASVVGAVAGTMIIVFVVVGFILRSKSSKKDEASSALMAASAAASEVANRA